MSDHSPRTKLTHVAVLMYVCKQPHELLLPAREQPISPWDVVGVYVWKCRCIVATFWDGRCSFDALALFFFWVLFLSFPCVPHISFALALYPLTSPCPSASRPPLMSFVTSINFLPVVIQNTTFGGIQGFTQRPSTPFFDSQGNFAGKVHQERNLTFALFAGAGHLIPGTKPDSVSVFPVLYLSPNTHLVLVPHVPQRIHPRLQRPRDCPPEWYHCRWHKCNPRPEHPPGGSRPDILRLGDDRGVDGSACGNSVGMGGICGDGRFDGSVRCHPDFGSALVSGGNLGWVRIDGLCLLYFFFSRAGTRVNAVVVLGSCRLRRVL